MQSEKDLDLKRFQIGQESVWQVSCERFVAGFVEYRNEEVSSVIACAPILRKEIFGKSLKEVLEIGERKGWEILPVW